jgi:hypothetical protein
VPEQHCFRLIGGSRHGRQATTAASLTSTALLAENKRCLGILATASHHTGGVCRLIVATGCAHSMEYIKDDIVQKEALKVTLAAELAALDAEVKQLEAKRAAKQQVLDHVLRCIASGKQALQGPSSEDAVGPSGPPQKRLRAPDARLHAPQPAAARAAKPKASRPKASKRANARATRAAPQDVLDLQDSRERQEPRGAHVAPASSGAHVAPAPAAPPPAHAAPQAAEALPQPGAVAAAVRPLL